MWLYAQQSGVLTHEGLVVARGYSGHLSGKDNPADQGVVNCGPIPQGLWQIGDPISGTHLGPMAMPLSPGLDTPSMGRTGFWIHGDNPCHPGNSSTGCIVLPLPARTAIAVSRDRLLDVTPD